MGGRQRTTLFMGIGGKGSSEEESKKRSKKGKKK